MSKEAKKITIYSTQTCSYCIAAKDFLKENNVEYTEIDVGADQEQAKIMIEKSGQMGVPVIVVGEGADEQILIGFDKNRLADSVGIA